MLPRKVWCFCAEILPLKSLQEEWSREPFGLRGRWDYVFKYEIGEFCISWITNMKSWGLRPWVYWLPMTGECWNWSGKGVEEEDGLHCLLNVREYNLPLATVSLPNKRSFSGLCSRKQQLLVAGCSVPATWHLRRKTPQMFLSRVF